MEVLSGFGVVLGGFQKDLEGFGRISGGSGERSPLSGPRISGPLRKVCSMSKEVSVGKEVEWRFQAYGQALGTPSAPRRGGGYCYSSLHSAKAEPRPL